MGFRDRGDAGRQLAAALSRFRGEDVVVLGLPRGGVPVAAPVAEALGAPLDVVVVRKLGVPFSPELAMGAIGEDGVRVLNDSVLHEYGLSADDVAWVEDRERVELEHRVARFRGGRPPVALRGRTAIVVDDGIATGATARAACQVVRALGARRLVLAVPVASADVLARLREVADEVVCLQTPPWLGAVGQAYDDFAQVDDDEVVELLRRAVGVRPSGLPRAHDVQDVVVDAAGVGLAGRLDLPAGARGVVLFAHGSGSSRHSPRNQHVARRLGEAGLGTLLFDLLTRAEEGDRGLVFDVALLGERLLAATGWLRDRLRESPGAEGLPVGYFGASTGAAAALWAAAQPSAEVGAVVSRGGRPDLAAPWLDRVTAPTLLIVGGADHTVLELNRRARAMMHAEVQLAVVRGAGHLFEEPGTLDAAADLAVDWFTRHLAGAVARTRAGRPATS
jgi:putative phosphoribosyl transferase